jgi:hypothetical protein
LVNYPPTASSIASLIRYLNIDLFNSGFLSLDKNRERELLRTRYRKAVVECNDIENDFYSNDSLNDNLDALRPESGFPFNFSAKIIHTNSLDQARAEPKKNRAHVPSIQAATRLGSAGSYFSQIQCRRFFI